MKRSKKNPLTGLWPLLFTLGLTVSAGAHPPVASSIAVAEVVSSTLPTLSPSLVKQGPASPAALPNLPMRDAMSDRVGASFGEFRVEEAGGATYSMPIFTVPGTAGVVPKLALAYSSQAGTGVMGKGWSIRGQSAITRCRKTREAGDFLVNGTPVDGNPQPIRYTNQDAFCLDGQRLLGVSGTYGSNNAEYRLELDPFTRVRSFGGNNGSAGYSGPTWFTVQRKDGSTSDYGNTLDARIDNCSNPNANCTNLPASGWALNRFEDSTGNYLLYTYVEDAWAYDPRGVDYQLLSVTYTGKRQLPGQVTGASAPYAGIYFNYDAIVSANGEESEIGYQGGVKFTQTQVLRSVEVKDQIDSFPRTVRFYDLTYSTSTSGSRHRLLRSIQECRTDPSPNAVPDPNAICYRPTTFKWTDEDGVIYSLDTADGQVGSGANARVGSSRLGDLDGDGRMDLVWFRRDDPSCSGTNRLRVGFGDRSESGGQSKLTLFMPDIPNWCTPLNAGNGELDSAWGLLDFDGDGRDDLAIADDDSLPNARWHIYRSLGRPAVSGGAVFDMANDLMNVTISTAEDSQDQAQFGDFNADGLIDIAFPTGANSLAIRFLQRKPDLSGFAYGPAYTVNALPADCAGYSCNLELFHQPTSGFGVASDFTGDGRADLVLRVIRSSNVAPPPAPTVTFYATDTLAIDHPEVLLGFETQRFYAFALDTKDDNALTQSATQYGVPLFVRNDSGPQDPRDFQFADFNGDGLADLFYYYPIQNNDDYRFALNLGNGFEGQSGSVASGMVSNVSNREQLRLVDVTGDGRVDVVYPSSDSLPCPGTLSSDRVFRYRSYTRRFNGFDDPNLGQNPQNGAICLPGNGAKAGTTTDAAYFFADFDGDGAVDYLKLRDKTGTTNVNGMAVSHPDLTISRASATRRFKPRDAITTITNGNGAVTSIAYQPMTNKAIYRRLKDSRKTLTWGRGSLVTDVLSSTYVVSQVSSSAPTPANPNAQSTIAYRYAGARAQAGGRGFLGFLQIVTLDMNAVDGGFTAGEQYFWQDFPFVGAAVQTGKFIFSGAPTRGTPTLDACAANPEASGQDCFYDPGDPNDAEHLQLGNNVPPGTPTIGGTLVHVSASLWGCRNSQGNEVCALPPDTSPTFCPGITWANAKAPQTSFLHAPGGGMQSMMSQADATALTGQQPLFPYVPRTVDVDFDPQTTLITRHICGLLQYDPYGNVSQNTIAQFAGPALASEVARKITTNTYVNDAVNWRLGRLMTSQIDDIRPTGVQTRFADFDYEVDRAGYASASDTGLLKAERVQKNLSSDEDLRTLYTLDDYGNRIGTFLCSRLKLDGSVLSDTDCRNKSLVQQRPLGANGPATAVHRYALTNFDPRGRYPVSTIKPYFSVVAPRQVNEQVSLTINTRDEFGNATQQTDANGRVTTALYGDLGRAYASADSSGQSVTTTFRWCSGAGSVSCPTGMSFRQQTVTAGAPTTFVYFDVLGRERLTTTQSFNAGVSGQNFAARCVGYDSHGRPLTSSIPFFLNGNSGTEPSFNGDPCLGVAATTTTFDVLGRARLVTAPDNSVTSVTFSALKTTTVDSRGQWQEQTKNALGEVIQTRQADPSSGQLAGAVLTVTNEYDPQGQLRFVKRNAGSGEIVSETQYDGLGRPTFINDPDRGTANFTYNAAGEVIVSVDAKGQRVEQDFDAQGRRWRRRTGTPLNFTEGGDRIFANGFEIGVSGTGLMTDTWQWDTAPYGLGSLAFEQRQFSSSGSVAFYRAMTYDTIGRPASRQSSFDGSLYTEATTYDSVGRVQSQQDASGDITTPMYTSRGHLSAQTYSRWEVGSGGMFYEVLAQDAWGHTTQERRAGNILTTTTFDSQRGWIDTVQTGPGGNLQNWNFNFDTNGNLTQRNQGGGARVETLSYDKLNRLTTVALSGFATVPSTTNVTYDTLGNVCSRGPNGAVINYAYAGRAGCALHGNAGSPHAVSQVNRPGETVNYGFDANGNQLWADSTINTNDRTVSYDALDQALLLARSGSAAQAEFAYGPDGARYRRIDRVNGAIVSTTRYIGNVEVIITANGTETKRYLAGGAIVATLNGGSATDRYALPDHLGSVDAVVSDSGALVESASFDAWGGRRNATTWQGAAAPLATTTRGFTGHEHVDNLNIIHFGGRLYDPTLGRFIQADTMLDAGIQGLNRYSYVLNRPLTLTDPTGHLSTHEWGSIFIAVVMAAGTGGAGVALTVGEKALLASAMGAMSGAMQSQSLKGAAWGAFSGAMFSGIGSYFQTANWATKGVDVLGTNLNAGGYAAKVLAHGVAGGVVQHLQGGKFGSGFAAAGVTQAASGAIDTINPSSAVVGSATRIMVAALIGGSVSEMTGGKYATGAITAAFARAFNEEGHNESVSRRRGAMKMLDEIESRALAEGNWAIYGIHANDGHAWDSLSIGDFNGNSDRHTFGLWAESFTAKAGYKLTPDDYDHGNVFLDVELERKPQASASAYFVLSHEQIRSFFNYVRTDPNYGYFSYNCASFVINSTRAATGITLSGGMIDDPANLKNSIKNLNGH